MISSLTSRFEFTNRRALFLSAHKAAVYQWQQGDIGSSYLFDVNEEGQSYFERYLDETGNAPFYILVDVFEEEFRRETIPHVFGPDRAAIIERKQARSFRDTPYRHYEIQGREEDGRRDDRILITGITNAEVLDPWVELLDKYKVPLAGIYSVPLFTGSLLKSIPHPSNHMLVVSLQSVSGLRQTFYQNNEFKISRLVQMPRYGTEPYAPYIAGEVEKIRRYINSLRLTAENEHLDIYFLTAGKLLDELKQEHTNTDDVRYHTVDLNVLSEEAGSAKTISNPFSDQFFVYNLLKRRPANCYASPTNKRYFSMRRMRYSMIAAAIMLVIGSTIWSGYTLFNGLSFKQQSLAAQNKTQFYTTRYQIARERLPQTPVEPADLEIAVKISETLEDYKTTPIESIRLIGRMLNRFPTIALDTFDWASSLDPNLKVGQNQSGQSNQGVVGYSDVNLNTENYAFYHISVLNGHIEPFDGNFRNAINLINEFVENIREQVAVHDVSILTLPLDVSSTANLTGNAQTQEKTANFSVRLVVGIKHEA